MRPRRPSFRAVLLCAATSLLIGSAARAAPAPDDDDEAKAPLSEIVVTARRLDAARANVELSVGAASYAVSNDVVENRPGGESANLVHVLLQFPGVAQSGAGALSVRSQSNLQYRINNIIVPEGFTDLAETLRARFADDIQLVRGALPAQYGLQVGGVVNVTSKNGVYERGGEFELYGGSHGRAETAFEAAGALGATNLYASGSYLHDDVGAGGVDAGRRPGHDATDQVDAFAFVDHILDAGSRVSLILGLSDDRSELPRAAAAPALSAPNGQTRSRTAYGIASYQGTEGPLTYQLAASVRDSGFRLTPDQGAVDVAAVGLSQALRNTTQSAGLQAEGVYELSEAHKLRAGATATAVRDRREALYEVRAPAGPVAPRDRDRRSESSLFLQDEWRAAAPLTFNLGLRYDSVSGAGGGDTLSPRLNAVWKAPGGATVHAGYARYLVPAPEGGEAVWPDRLAGTSGAAPGPASHAPRAEIDDYLDLGVEQGLGDLKLGLEVYRRDASNLLDAVRVGSTPLRRPFNFADGRARGVELYATYADGPLTAWANLAFARAEGRGIVSGEAGFTAAELAAADRFVPVSTDQRVTASVGASYHWRAYRLSGDAVYGSGLPRTAAGGPANGARLPDYVQVNASVVRRLEGLADMPLDLRVDVVNLFDARYALRDATGLDGGAPQWGPRRGVFVGLEQKF